MEKVKKSRLIITNKAIDEALCKGLDPEGLMRLAAVDRAVAFCMNQNIPNETMFQTIYDKIYKFLKTKEE
jgi:hypothetical protein